MSKRKVVLKSESAQTPGPAPQELAELRAATMAGDPGQALPKVDEALREFPQNPDVQRYAGILHYRRKDFALAESFLTQAFTAAPSDAEAAMFLMRVFYNAGNDPKCEEIARALLDLSANNADALRTLGRIYNRRSDWERASEMWEALSKTNPDDPEAALQAARCFRRLGKTEQALELAEKALAVDPANTEVLRIKVEAAIALRRYDALSGVIVKYYELHPDRALILLRRLAQGEAVPTAAAMMVSLRTARPEDEEVRQVVESAAEEWHMVAIRAELQREDKNAAIHLCALRTLNPGNPALTESLERVKGYFVTAMKDATLTGNNEAVFASAELVLMLDPKAHDAWFAIGRNTLINNDPAGAIAPLRSATECDPENAWYWLNYGRALRQSGDLVNAIPAYRRVTEKSPDAQHVAEATQVLSRVPSMLLANARQALGEGRPMEVLAVHEFLTMEAPANPYLAGLLAASMHTLLGAVRQGFKAQLPATHLLAERYLAYEPDNTEVELILARTLMREKAYEEALPVWEKLSRAKPDEAHYHLQMARCHARLGHGDTAIAAGRRVLALDPTIAEAGTIIAQFETPPAIAAE
jgi:tetratricopeptide (TPR) repeat protein